MIHVKNSAKKLSTMLKDYAIKRIKPTRFDLMSASNSAKDLPNDFQEQVLKYISVSIVNLKYR